MSGRQTADPDAIGIGHNRARPDGQLKVSGRYEFAPDLYAEDMLWAATTRSPHPYARVVRVNLKPAKAMPGVQAVLGAWDVPDNRYGVINRDTPVLADDYVRYQGEPIAIVAARDRETARRAAAAVEVEYEILSPLTDAIAALESGTCYRHVNIKHGDLSVTGEVQAEGEYSTARQDHSFLAPDAGLARPDGRGGVELIGATQWVFSDRQQVAAALDLPVDKVLVRNSGVGGSFGGRFVLSWQVHGALLALHTDRPVKFTYSRDETFLARYHRQPSRIWIRHHASRDGTITKVEARVLYENGPYSNTAAAGIGNGCSLIQGAYNIPNAHVEGWAVATNNGMTGSLRGFGVVEAIFACESNIDNLARVLGMSGSELRLKNAISTGDRWINNQVQYAPAPVAEMIEHCTQMPLLSDVDTRAVVHPVNLPGGPGTPTRPRDVRRGVSLATAAKNVCLSEGAQVGSTVLITLRDGVALVECAAAEVGQGFVTVATQITQTALGVSHIELAGPVDTAMPPAATTDGQQQTMTSGSAVAVAAKKLKQRFLQFYAREHRLDPSQLDVVADHVVDVDGTELDSVADAGMGLVFRATDTFTQRPTRPLEDTDSPNPQHVAMNFSVNRTTVDIDPELGLVKVAQMDIVQDVGRVVNPLQARGQIEGGSLMGQGLALAEHLEFAAGRVLNGNWDGYLVPSAVDAPHFNIDFFERPEPGIPYGMRGIAELPVCQAPPAVLSALRVATGLQLPKAPATHDYVSGLTSYEPSSRLQGAGEQLTKGPWKVPQDVADYGPWRASKPAKE